MDDLVEHGWIPLRSMAVLLGHRELRGIYQRQRGKKAIPIIQVGGIKRVYGDVVLQTLRDVPSHKKRDADMILDLYRTIKRKQDH